MNEEELELKGIGKSLFWVFFWMALALSFNAGVWYFLGQDKALEFLGGYLIELSLSIDNLFVFISIFVGYGVAEHAQHRVLKYGIMGAIILRFIFIFFGVQVVTRFEWVLYIFGAILIINGIKMFKKDEVIKDPHESGVVKLLGKLMPMTPRFVGEKFFVKQGHKRFATPLFAVLVLVEFSDIIFAIDSVPAVFSVSTDLLIVYSSNIFAILGLRQLYFVLEHLHERFMYVKYGVATILTFTGIKLGIGIFHMHIPTSWSICFILATLTISIVLSVIVSGIRVKGRRRRRR